MNNAAAIKTASNVQKKGGEKMSIFINGIEDVRKVLGNPEVNGQNFALLFNPTTKSVFLEESASNSTIQKFESDGMIYCGNIVAQKGISNEEIINMANNAVHK